MVCRHFTGFLLVFAALGLSGCRSASYGDRYGAGGALAGAGVGYLIGDAVGNEGAGTAIGAITGLIAGSAVGEGMDEIQASNRAEIEAKLGRQLATGSVTVPDVIDMTRAGVDPGVIENHIRANGVAGPLQSNDLILLSQQGVNPRVIAAMQSPPQPARAVAPASYAAPAPPPGFVVEHYYAPPPGYFPPPRYYYPPPCRPHGVSWGVSVSH
ncbi:MAG: glycine zipper domain-containing protein [Pirellulales bacterium]|nr:glycine zipper domain-containing protein [Pirellulales bacterium]